MNLLERLGEVELFQGLSGAKLNELAARATLVDLAPGDVLIEEGSESDAMYVVLEGQLTVTRATAGEALPLGNVGPGQLVGEMAVLEQAPRNATVRAVVATRAAALEAGDVLELLNDPSAAIAMVRTVVGRLRQTELALRQAQKMKLLGETTAFLLHEINNPASAARRGASELLTALDRWQATLTAVTPDEAGLLTALEPGPPPFGLERVRSEAQLEAWLSQRGVRGGEAAALAAAGFRPEHLEGLLSGIPPERTAAVLQAIAAEVEVRGLAGELALAAERVSVVVEDVRLYAYEGRTLVADYDVHRGIDVTLRILGARLDHIEVVRDLDPELPKIGAHGGRLNQVWTNLLTNAMDAMGDDGTLTVRTRRHGDGIVVEVGDTGGGIPEEVRERIFEPFFTTKELEKGTGLGLPAAFAIVSEHHGEISFDTGPSGTTFRVELPLRQPV